MYLLAAYLLLLLSSHEARSAEESEHRDFQYNSVVDPKTGRYNFAYDTGHDNDIAHAMHMQYRDANGIVRGRYGYTDPRGKLRMVEYEAGPNGFVARGDVGPDRSLHDQAPETQVPQFARYTQEEDIQLVPRPVQMAGWDPVGNPIGQPVSSSSVGTSDQGESDTTTQTDSGSTGLGGYATTNDTSNSQEVYVARAETYDGRYPRISISTNENRRELEDLTSQIPGQENQAEIIPAEYPVSGSLTADNIDVKLNDIRVAANRSPVRRSAGGDASKDTSSLPYSYRNYNRQTHDHDAELANQATGYRAVYRVPHNDHYHEGYYMRPTHDHDAERKYVSNRQTHDHDAERRYYINRQTHDHDAERRYYANRQTHDHDAERRYYVSRYTHDHDAERPYYYRGAYYRDVYPNRRIYYKDSHSMVPHLHNNHVYHNDSSHNHSDVHLYGRSQNLQYPATVRPRLLKYIPADKYHDKYYYWND